MRACILFPGQGFQKFGMLAGLAAKYPRIVDPILERCEATLPQLHLSRLLLGEGTSVDVTPTEIAQPLLLAHGVAHYEVWKQVSADPLAAKFAMGHSLGEYTAFVAAELLSLEDGLRLVSSRGTAMQNAAQLAPEPTGMSAFVKPKALSAEVWSGLLNRATAETGTEVAAFNSPTLTVVSGTLVGINKAVELLKASSEVTAAKARVLAKRLPVSGAFHSQFMEPAAQSLKNLVENADWNAFGNSQLTVISNVSGRPYTSLSDIKRSCVVGLTSPVKWLQSVQFLDFSEEVYQFIAMGGDIHKLMENSTRAQSSSFDAES